MKRRQNAVRFQDMSVCTTCGCLYADALRAEHDRVIHGRRPAPRMEKIG